MEKMWRGLRTNSTSAGRFTTWCPSWQGSMEGSVDSLRATAVRGAAEHWGSGLLAFPAGPCSVWRLRLGLPVPPLPSKGLAPALREPSSSWQEEGRAPLAGAGEGPLPEVSGCSEILDGTLRRPALLPWRLCIRLFPPPSLRQLLALLS